MPTSPKSSGGCKFDLLAIPCESALETFRGSLLDPGLEESVDTCCLNGPRMIFRIESNHSYKKLGLCVVITTLRINLLRRRSTSRALTALELNRRSS